MHHSASHNTEGRQIRRHFLNDLGLWGLPSHTRCAINTKLREDTSVMCLLNNASGWVQVSFPGKPKRRAAAIGFLAAFANTANIAGGYFFVSSKYGPTYRTSFALVLAMFAAAIVATLGTRFYLKFRNRQLDRLEREGVVTTSGALVDKAAEANNISTAQAEALSNKFRYFT